MNILWRLVFGKVVDVEGSKVCGEEGSRLGRLGFFCWGGRVGHLTRAKEQIESGEGNRNKN